MHVDYSNVMMI